MESLCTLQETGLVRECFLCDRKFFADEECSVFFLLSTNSILLDLYILIFCLLIFEFFHSIIPTSLYFHDFVYSPTLALYSLSLYGLLLMSFTFLACLISSRLVLSSLVSSCLVLQCIVFFSAIFYILLYYSFILLLSSFSELLSFFFQVRMRLKAGFFSFRHAFAPEAICRPLCTGKN